MPIALCIAQCFHRVVPIRSKIFEDGLASAKGGSRSEVHTGVCICVQLSKTHCMIRVRRCTILLDDS
jgi:hypothetical protein